MAQFLRPASNVTQTTWTGGFAEIDEAVASDTDFSYGANNSSTATLEVLLSAGSAPSAGTCTVRWRHAKVSTGVLSGTGGTVNQTVGLYEGTTLIQSSTVTTGGTWTAASFTFSSASVTNWSNLRLRFTQTASGGGGNARGSAVSWAEVELPDPPPMDGSVLSGSTATGGLIGLLFTQGAVESISIALGKTDDNLYPQGKIFNAIATQGTWTPQPSNESLSQVVTEEVPDDLDYALSPDVLQGPGSITYDISEMTPGDSIINVRARAQGQAATLVAELLNFDTVVYTSSNLSLSNTAQTFTIQFNLSQTANRIRITVS